MVTKSDSVLQPSNKAKVETKTKKEITTKKAVSGKKEAWQAVSSLTTTFGIVLATCLGPWQQQHVAK